MFHWWFPYTLCQTIVYGRTPNAQKLTIPELPFSMRNQHYFSVPPSQMPCKTSTQNWHQCFDKQFATGKIPIAHAIRDQTLARKLNSLLQTLCSNAAEFFLAHSPYFTSCEPFCATNFSPLSGSFDTALKSSLLKPKPNNRDPRLRARPIITLLLLRFCQFAPNEPPFYASKARMCAPFFAQTQLILANFVNA